MNKTQTTHELKIDPIPFTLTMDGKKPFEVRYNDRDFKIGDGLILRETVYDHRKMQGNSVEFPLKYTGRELFAIISCALCNPMVRGVADGYYTLGLSYIRLVTEEERDQRIAGQVQEKEVESNTPTSIDWKFRIHAENRATGVVRTDEEGILFLAQDDAVIPMLKVYRSECELLGADYGHLRSVDLLIERVYTWRAMNPNMCKTPDMSKAEEPIQIDGEFTD